jgi:hypothetical protein
MAEHANCRRRFRHTTTSSNTDIESLVVTHPFHPLTGQRLPILFERRYKSAAGKVYICDGGSLGSVTLPEFFTDRGAPAAPRALTMEVLIDVAEVVSILRTKLDTQGRRP